MSFAYKFGQFESSLNYEIDSLAAKDIEELTSSFTSNVLNDFKVEAKKNDDFSETVNRKWSNSLSALKHFIDLNFEFVSGYRDKNNKKIENNEYSSFLALIQLHARAILVSKEIVVLLENGFPDGAFARWRTLHEIAVCISVIAHSEESGERFLHAEHVKNASGARCYNQYHEKLNHAPIPDEQIELNSIREQEALKVLGEKYEKLGDYEWARPFSDVKGLKKKKRISLRYLEEETQLDHYRPYYTWACEKTHAQSKANYGNLGTNNERAFLVGPSKQGLLEPIDCTVLSLTIISAACMTYYPCMDSIVSMKLLASLSTLTIDIAVKDNKEC